MNKDLRRSIYSPQGSEQAVGQFVDDLQKDSNLAIPLYLPRLDKAIPEQRFTPLRPGNLISVMMSNSQGKCLAGDTLITTGHGDLVPIKDLPDHSVVIAIDNNMKLSRQFMTKSVSNGIKPVARLTLRSGKAITATLNHPFLKITGWAELGDLAVGDYVATPRHLPVQGVNRMSEEKIKILAYLIGDGYLGGTSPMFTNLDKALSDDFVDAVSKFGGVSTVRAESEDRTPTWRVKGIGQYNPLTEWLREIGLMGHKSYTKFVPQCIFRLPNQQLALFLNRLFSTDGWASSSGNAEIGYGSNSEHLIRDVQHLLLRFGVVSRIARKKSSLNGKTFMSWQLIIQGHEFLDNFIKQIGIYSKEDAIGRVAQTIQTRTHSNADLVPKEAWKFVVEAKENEQLPWPEQDHRRGLAYQGQHDLGRAQMQIYADYFSSPDLDAFAFGDIYWDKIKSIEMLGEQETYDVEVPVSHNFVANDIIVHNTSFALWHALQRGIWLREHNILDRAVVIVTAETMVETLLIQMVSSLSNIAFASVLSGDVDEDQLKKFKGFAAAKIPDLPVWIVGHSASPDRFVKNLDISDQMIDAALGEIENWGPHSKHVIDIVYVDYLQVISLANRVNLGHSASKPEMMAQLAGNLKSIGLKHSCVVWMNTQARREAEQTTAQDKMPGSADSAWSAEVERITDVLLAAWRPIKYHADGATFKANGDKTYVCYPWMWFLKIYKHRFGPAGMYMEINYNAALAQFSHVETKRL